MAQIHATAVAVNGNGILLTGESGSGKSDLALRLIQQDARLIADDRCDVFATAHDLNVSPPAALRGMLEVRGIGIVVLPYEENAPVALVFRMTGRETIDRLPEAKTTTIEGIELPLFDIDPFESSAPDKVRIALQMITGTIGSVA